MLIKSVMKVIFVLLVIVQSSIYANNKPANKPVKNNLFVFTGELKSLKKVASPAIVSKKSKNGQIDVFQSMDNKYVATFKILKEIYGSYPKKMITFDVYDHYGRPSFSKFKNTLMFVSKRKNGSFYHEKYQFFDIYKTQNGKWASCGNPYKFDTNPPKRIAAKKIPFTGIVAYKTSDYVHTQEQLLEFFPNEYFTIIGDYAICNGFGTYVTDLFEIKKEGVLKARGLF